MTDKNNSEAHRSVKLTRRARASVAPLTVLAAAVALFAVANSNSNEIISYYLHGAAAATLACAIGWLASARFCRA